MTQDTRFYSNLPYETATNRLQHVNVQGVNISVKQTEPQTTEFRLDLQKQTPAGTLIMAHLKGTVQEVKGGKIQVAYQTYAFSANSLWMLIAGGMTLSFTLLLLLPTNLTPIISAPGVISIMIVLFWSILGDDIRKDDRFRLEELIERMLEKHTTMATWQA